MNKQKKKKINFLINANNHKKYNCSLNQNRLKFFILLKFAMIKGNQKIKKLNLNLIRSKFCFRKKFIRK